MTPSNTILENGQYVGCPDIDGMKRWFWAAADATSSENFLFPAAAYYTMTDIMRGNNDVNKVRFLINECILNRFGGLYLNVTSQLRSAASGVSQGEQFDNLGLVLPILAGATDEAVHFLYNNGQIQSRLRGYKPSTKQKRKSKKWMTLFFGAKETYTVMVKTKVGKFSRGTSKENIDAVLEGWGDAPWLHTLRSIT